MEVVALDPASPRWTAALQRVPHDAYHLPSFVSFAARRQERGRPVLFVVEDGNDILALPLILREVPAGLRPGGAPIYDAASPRGYPGPLVAVESVSAAEAFTSHALAALQTYLQQQAIVTAFIRMHPLLPVAEDAFASFGGLVDHGDSVFVDLRQSDEDFLAQMRPSHRREINRAQRMGYVARMDETWERFDDFIAIYQESMERVGATSYWRLTRDYFWDLRESLADALHLCVVERDGDIAGAALLTEEDGIVEYHLAGTANAHRRASPSKLVIDFSRTWAKRRGNRVFHLTGSLGRGDSLSRFKMGFSPLHRPVRSWRFVTDPDMYATLTAGWLKRNGAAGAADDYFPAYRRPPSDDG